MTRDAFDVTDIKAQSPADAWFAIGYVHAQERGWQLRTLGIMQAAERLSLKC